MANDYLVSKWKMWFSWFDHNGDGKVGAADLEASRNIFANLHHLTAERKKSVMDNYTAWWSEYLMWGKSEIIEAEFVECQRKAFEADKEMFIKRMWENQELVCNLMDTDGDGMITEQDHIVLFKSTHHNDEAFGRRWFKAYDPVDGKVTVNKLVELWARFLTSEDSSKPDFLAHLLQANP